MLELRFFFDLAWFRTILYRNVKYVNHASEEFNPPVAPRDLPSQNELPYLTLRDSTCGGTSKAATVAVTTRALQICQAEKLEFRNMKNAV